MPPPPPTSQAGAWSALLLRHARAVSHVRWRDRQRSRSPRWCTAQRPQGRPVRSLYRLLEDSRLNHRRSSASLLADECAAQLRTSSAPSAPNRSAVCSKVRSPSSAEQSQAKRAPVDARKAASRSEPPSSARKSQSEAAPVECSKAAKRSEPRRVLTSRKAKASPRRVLTSRKAKASTPSSARKAATRASPQRPTPARPR